VFTNNDSTNSLIAELRAAGVSVEAVIDVRAGVGVVDTVGDETGLRQVAIGSLDGERLRTVDCDLLCVSGGFNPAIHLFSQAQGRLRYDERLACFVPDNATQTVRVVGAANGELDHVPVGGIQPCWTIPNPEGDGSTHFIDLERDVTLADVRRALGTGMRSVEHIKRYTTIGTGSDQGKTAGVNESAIVATQLGQPVAAVGTTTFRPPYAPVAFALMAGRNQGYLFEPIRVTSIHSWHVAHGAVFENVGQWKRPWYYPQPGETMEAAVLRECAAARQGVGVQDVSTLGKIDIQGPDALEFLNRIYTNAFDTLAIGSCRYSVMCKPDGMFFDDGVVIRLGPQRYLATTTTGGAAGVLDHLEEWLQTEWPELRVRLTSVTEQWAAAAVVGPRSREVLSRLAPELRLDPETMPFMSWREARVAGIAARVHRITFSGELAFEVWVPSWYGLALWEAIMTQAEDITPYGTEAMHVLRAEKGYVIVGQDTDGTVTPQDLGMSWIVSRKKKDFIGRRSHQRADIARADRKHLVGLLPDDPDDLIPEGSQLVAQPDRQQPPIPMLGHVTSSYRSVALGRSFALALVKSGRERLGSTIYAHLPDRVVAATITEPVFYDRENQRRDS
jgi:sarcosine oxidase subunit alpha